MKLNTKIGTLVAVGAMAVAVPAAAHSPNSHSTGHGGNSGSHKCQAHRRAYVEGGTVDSATPSTLAQNSDGTWSGTLVVDVTRANHTAKADRGQTVSYTFDSAQLNVRLDGGATGFDSGNRVRLIGKLATVGRRCPAPDPAPAPEFKRIVVHPANSTDSTTSGSGSDTTGS